MTKFTKEQLIEWAQTHKKRAEEYLAAVPGDEYGLKDLAMFEIALAALTEQPVGYYRKATTGDGYYLSRTIEPRPGTIPLYRMPLLEGLK